MPPISPLSGCSGPSPVPPTTSDYGQNLYAAFPVGSVGRSVSVAASSVEWIVRGHVALWGISMRSME